MGKVYHKGKGKGCTTSRDDWETPAELFLPLQKAYCLRLDVCASAENAKCDCYFSVEDDGLALSWRDAACWMNPPYSQAEAWMAKAVAETQASAGCLVVGLVAARTCNVWWHEWVMPYASEIWLLRGRVKFVGADNGAPFPSAVVVWDGQTIHHEVGRPLVCAWDWRREPFAKPRAEGASNQ